MIQNRMSSWKNVINCRPERDLTLSQARIRIALSLKHGKDLKKYRLKRLQLASKTRSYDTTIKIQSLDEGGVKSKLKTVIKALQAANGYSSPSIPLLYKYTQETLNAYADRKTPCGRLRTHDDYRQDQACKRSMDYNTLMLQESLGSLQEYVALSTAIQQRANNDLPIIKECLVNICDCLKSRSNTPEA